MGLATLGHVELLCPDLEESREHWTNMVSLEETTRDDGRVYLRGYAEWATFSLILTEADRNGIGHMAFQVEEKGDLETYEQRVSEAGLETTWKEPGFEPGMGRALRFEHPGGSALGEIELYHEIDRVSLPEDKQSALLNQPQKVAQDGIGAQRIDHATVMVPNVEEVSSFFQDILDFEVRERLVTDGQLRGEWLSVSPLVHEIAVVEGERPTFHHVSYKLKTQASVFRAADILKANDMRITAGPAQHGIARANCLYYLTPSGNQAELYAGGYLIFDPNWEPITWTEKDLPGAVYWWGRGRDWSPLDSEVYQAYDVESSESE